MIPWLYTHRFAGTKFVPPVPPSPATYRLLADHFVNSLLPAGTIVTEGVEIPFGFPTSGAMEPINDVGIANFRRDGAQSANLQLFYPAAAFNLTPPTIYWALVNGQWTLIGA